MATVRPDGHGPFDPSFGSIGPRSPSAVRPLSARSRWVALRAASHVLARHNRDSIDSELRALQRNVGLGPDFFAWGASVRVWVVRRRQLSGRRRSLIAIA